MKKLLGTKSYNGNEYRFYSSSFYDYCDNKECYYGHVVNQKGIEVYSEGNEFSSPWTFEELVESYEEYLKLKGESK